MKDKIKTFQDLLNLYMEDEIDFILFTGKVHPDTSKFLSILNNYHEPKDTIDKKYIAIIGNPTNDDLEKLYRQYQTKNTEIIAVANQTRYNRFSEDVRKDLFRFNVPSLTSEILQYIKDHTSTTFGDNIFNYMIESIAAYVQYWVRMDVKRGIDVKPYLYGKSIIENQKLTTYNSIISYMFDEKRDMYLIDAELELLNIAANAIHSTYKVNSFSGGKIYILKPDAEFQPILSCVYNVDDSFLVKMNTTETGINSKIFNPTIIAFTEIITSGIPIDNIFIYDNYIEFVDLDLEKSIVFLSNLSRLKNMDRGVE